MNYAIQKSAPSQKCFYILLLRHYCEVHKSVLVSLNAQKHQPWQSYHTCVASLFSRRNVRDMVAQTPVTYIHRCETSLPGHSTHASAAAYCATSCAMCSCRWGHVMVIMVPLLRTPAVISTQMEHYYFIRIQYNKKCTWKCVWAWPIYLQRHCMTRKLIIKRTMWPLHNITFDGKVWSWTEDQVVSLMLYWLASGNGKHTHIYIYIYIYIDRHS